MSRARHSILRICHRPLLRVVLVEDSAMLRGMLCEMLAELDGVGVVAEAEDEQGGACRARAAPRPDLAIIDLELRMGSGLACCGNCRPSRSASAVRAVVFSNHGHAPVRALRATRRQALLRQILPDRRTDRLRPGAGHSRYSGIPG